MTLSFHARRTSLKSSPTALRSATRKRRASRIAVTLWLTLHSPRSSGSTPGRGSTASTRLPRGLSSSGLYIELKHYPFYKRLGFDGAAKLAELLKAKGYDRAPERIFIQSFFKEALLSIGQLAPRYPRVQLLPMEDAGRKDDSSKITAALAQEMAGYAQGAGPSKTMLKDAADVETLHKAGLVIHPYTFRGQTLAVARRPLDEKQANGATVRDNIITDIQHYLSYGIDGGFTDYPQLWREATR